MPEVEDEIRTALRMLEPRIAEFESRLREAAAACAPGDASLQPLRDILHLLVVERQRLGEHLKQVSC